MIADISGTDVVRRPVRTAPGGVPPLQAQKPRRGLGAKAGQRVTPFVLLLPAMAVFAVFTVYPVFRQFDVSFFNWQVLPGAKSPFVGWSNFSHIFQDPEVRTAAFNTLLYIVITIPVQMALGLFAAAVLTDRLPGSALWRALVFIPVVTSWVVVSYLFAFLFSPQGGLVDSFLGLFAGHAVHFDWLAYRWTTNIVIWLVGIWKGVGWSFIIFLAALDGVPRDVIEAGRVDGASERRVWRSLIIPSIRPSITFVLVLLVIGAATVFQSVWLITSSGAAGSAGSPYGSTHVLYTYAYQLAFTDFQFGYAAAIASLLAVVLFGLSIAEIHVLKPRGE
ncbi:MAG: carbohydrate ABC transporter permease [Acidimicrobiales bacterium]